jgi:arsenite methyltransferase
VGADEYILLTDSAYQELSLPAGSVEPHEETYDELGTIKAFVYYPPEPEAYMPDSNFKLPAVFIESLRDEVAQEYAQVAQYPELGFHFHTGRRLTKLLAYKDEWLENFPDKVIESFAGTGNPFTLGEVKEGDRIVDVGCGAGLDCLIAANMVGPEGEVIGIDMTAEMIEKAHKNAKLAGIKNVTFKQGYSEELPIPDEWADVIFSNGALNLSPDKDGVYAEIFRVLKPGGRIQVGDIIVQKPLSESAKQNIELWAG